MAKIGTKTLDLQSLSITLMGTNNQSLTGVVNVSALAGISGTQEPEVDDYDDSGAAYYVCAVILVYGLSIVSLIGSLAKKKLKDKTGEVEEAQIHKYLHQVPDLREKSARDNFRQLKRDVIKLVEETGTPDVNEPVHSDGSFPGGKDSAKNSNGKSTEKRTPHHIKGIKRQQHQQALKSETQHLLAECGPDDRIAPDSPSSGQMEFHLGDTVPFERLENCEPEETITLVTDDVCDQETDPGVPVAASASLPASTPSGSDQNRPQSTTIPSGTPSDGKQRKGRAQYRWSLGNDGNIWIMQVDEKGEERLAPPLNVTSPPPPPSPGYTPTRFSQKFRHRSPGRESEQSPETTVSYIDESRFRKPSLVSSTCSAEDYSERFDQREASLPHSHRPSSLILPQPNRTRSTSSNDGPPRRHSHRDRRSQRDQDFDQYSATVEHPGDLPKQSLQTQAGIHPNSSTLSDPSSQLRAGASAWSEYTQHHPTPPSIRSKHESTVDPNVYYGEDHRPALRSTGVTVNGDYNPYSRTTPTQPSRSSQTQEQIRPTSKMFENLDPPPRYGPRLSPKLQSSRDRSISPRSSKSSRGGSPRLGAALEGSRRSRERELILTSEEEGDGGDLVHVTCV